MVIRRQRTVITHLLMVVMIVYVGQTKGRLMGRLALLRRVVLSSLVLRRVTGVPIYLVAGVVRRVEQA